MDPIEIHLHIFTRNRKVHNINSSSTKVEVLSDRHKFRHRIEHTLEGSCSTIFIRARYERTMSSVCSI